MSRRDADRSRNVEFQRNRDLEELLLQLNRELACANDSILASLRNDVSHPLVFVMGPLRSGTTLFMQALASTGAIAYPTNLLSRFYGAPLVGARIQLLFDSRYNFRDELLDLRAAMSFESSNGKTTGALAPNEFWYFWRRFVQFGDIDWMPDESLHRHVDKNTLVQELVGLTRVLGMPFALKAMILNYNIGFLSGLFENAIFVQLKRDPIATVSSILKARRRQFGNEAHWYSFKIPEYEQLKDMEPLHQAAGQVHFISRALETGMDLLPESRKLVVDYEEFCRHPESVLRELLCKVGVREWAYGGPRTFTIRRSNGPESTAISEALDQFALSAES